MNKCELRKYVTKLSEENSRLRKEIHRASEANTAMVGQLRSEVARLHEREANPPKKDAAELQFMSKPELVNLIVYRATQLDKADIRIAELERDRDTHAEDSRLKDDRILRLQESVRDWKDLADSAQEQRDAAKTTARMAQEQLDAARAEVAEVKAELVARAELHEDRSLVPVYLDELVAARAEVERQTKRAEALKAECERLEIAVDQQSNAWLKATAEASGSRSAATQLRDEVERLKAELAERTEVHDVDSRAMHYWHRASMDECERANKAEAEVERLNSLVATLDDRGATLNLACLRMRPVCEACELAYDQEAIDSAELVNAVEAYRAGEPIPTGRGSEADRMALDAKKPRLAVLDPEHYPEDQTTDPLNPKTMADIEAQAKAFKMHVGERRNCIPGHRDIKPENTPDGAPDVVWCSIGLPVVPHWLGWQQWAVACQPGAGRAEYLSRAYHDRLVSEADTKGWERGFDEGRLLDAKQASDHLQSTLKVIGDDPAEWAYPSSFPYLCGRVQYMFHTAVREALEGAADRGENWYMSGYQGTPEALRAAILEGGEK